MFENLTPSKTIFTSQTSSRLCRCEPGGECDACGALVLEYQSCIASYRLCMVLKLFAFKTDYQNWGTREIDFLPELT